MQKVMKEGHSESSAWAICRKSLKERLQKDKEKKGRKGKGRKDGN